MAKGCLQASSLEDFFTNFKRVVENQDLKAISSFYDQNQADFFKKEINKWKNIFSSALTKDLKVKYYLLGGNSSERFVIYDISSSDPLFNLIFSNTFTSHPYILRKINEAWKFYGDTRLSEFYIPLEEEVNTVIDPLAHEIHVMQRVKLKSVRSNVPALVFLLSDELKVSACSEEGRNLQFEQFGHLLCVERPLIKLEDESILTVKYAGKVEKYKECNNHYIYNSGGILRSVNFWHLSLSSYEELLLRPVKLTIDLPKDFFAVANSGQLIFSKENGTRLIQKWDIPAADSNLLGFIFYNSWTMKTYDTGINKLILCFDKDSKLETGRIIALSVDIMKTYQEIFGEISIRDFYILDYNFGFNRKNYIPADINILSHELAHLWWDFPGEWWLNEGFAVYAEFLYVERSKGQSEFLQKLNALKKEMSRTMEGGVDLPLVGSGYHKLLYSKGALVVHALRMELGDSLFFKTLKNFIAKFYDKNPTWKELRSTAENLSGYDLGFFFDQWLLRSGLPCLELQYEVFKDGKRFKVSGKVTQEGLFYRLSSKLVISGSGKEKKHELLLDKSEVSFTFPVFFEPEIVDLEISEGIPCVHEGAGLSAKKSSLEEKGIKALDTHDYERAVENFKELLNLTLEKSESALTSYMMAKALFGLGRYSDTAEQFKQALNYADLPLNYRYASILYLGKSSLCDGNREKAIEYFNRLIATPDAPEYYKTEASRFSQYLGLIKTPPNGVKRIIEALQKAINEKNESALKALSRWLAEDKQIHIISLGKYPLSDFQLRVELVLDAGDNKYHIECFASGVLRKQIISGDFIILTQKINEEIELIDVIRIQMK